MLKMSGGLPQIASEAGELRIRYEIGEIRYEQCSGTAFYLLKWPFLQPYVPGGMAGNVAENLLPLPAYTSGSPAIDALAKLRDADVLTEDVSAEEKCDLPARM